MAMTEVNGFGLLDLMATMKRRQNRYLALVLGDIEEYMLQIEDDEVEKEKLDFMCDPRTFKQRKEMFDIIRKFVLDTFNDYTRSTFNLLLGEDIENLNFR